MKPISISLLLTFFSVAPHLIAQDVWFVDAGAGIVRANPGLDTYSYVIFNGVSFPDNVVVDEENGVMYWTDWTKDKIRKADLDGRNVEDVVLDINNPKGMTLDTDGQFLYWVESIEGEVKKARTDGTMVEVLISGLTLPEDIIVDIADGLIFVTTNQGIHRLRTDGSEPTLILSGNGISGIDYNPATGHVYYGTSTQEIRRMTINGQEVQTIISGAGNNIDGLFFDPVQNKIYWADYTNKKLFRANLDGSGRETLITSPDSGISDMYFDATENMLYWVEPSNSEVLRKSLTTNETEKILDGDRWGQISDISISPFKQKAFFIDRDSRQIVSIDWSGENATVILDSLDGVVSLIFDAYGNDLYWSDRLDKIIYRSDASGRNITPLITNVDVISMDIDFATKTMYFIDLTDKKIKYANLDNPVVQTINNPPFTVPEDLAVQMETRTLFWIDDTEEEIYRMSLSNQQHQLYINQATNMSYIEASESLSGLLFIDAGVIIYTDDVNPAAYIIYYPGQVFPHSVRVAENAFIFDLMPTYELSEELLCDNDTITVTIDPYGAIPPVTYSWPDGYVSTNAVRHGVPEGDHTVNIKDLINRTATISIPLISQFDAPSVYVDLDHAVFPNLGAGQAHISGGQPPYVLHWLGNGFEAGNVMMVDQLQPGEYSLTVMDNNGCITTEYFAIESVNAVYNASIEGLRVFPTMTSEAIHVFTEAAGSDEISGYALFDMHARLVDKQKVAGNTIIDVNHLSPGLYTLKIFADQKWTSVRFVKL